jgi:ADP-heptose:LPS heptosyltransferase
MHPRRTLIVRLDSMGDVLLTGPAVRAAAQHAHVTMLVGPKGRDVAELLPGVHEVITYHAPWIADDTPALRRDDVDELLRAIAVRRFDEAAVLTSARQSCLPTALLLRMAGVPRIVGISVDSPGSLLDDVIRGDPDLHEVERALAVVGLLGHERDTDVPPLAIDQRAVDPAIACGLPLGYVVVHPGASVPARTLSPDRWRRVVATLTSRGVPVVLTGAAHETAACAVGAGVGGTADVVDLGGRTDVRELAAVLRGADVMCVGNTGPMHLAAAVGTPVCAVMPPTVPPARWRPWGVDHVLLGNHDIGCAACRARRCPVVGQPCLEAVEDLVADHVEALTRNGKVAAA